MKKLVTVIVTGIIVLGMGYTVFFDYKPWVRAEKDNYGHGPGELGTKGVANKLFVQDEAGVRINYPENWTVQDLWTNKKVHPQNEVVTFLAPKSDVKIKVVIYDMKGSQVDIADARVKERLGWGWVPWGERQYISNDRTNVTVVTWQVKQADGKVIMLQEGLAKKGERLVVVDAESSLSEWRTYKGTFWEMFSSVVIF